MIPFYIVELNVSGCNLYVGARAPNWDAFLVFYPIQHVFDGTSLDAYDHDHQLCFDHIHHHDGLGGLHKVRPHIPSMKLPTLPMQLFFPGSAPYLFGFNLNLVDNHVITLKLMLNDVE